MVGSILKKIIQQFSQNFKYSKLQEFSFTTYLGLLKTLGRINLESLNKSKNLIMAFEFLICPSLNILKFWMFGNLRKIFAVDSPTQSLKQVVIGLLLFSLFSEVWSLSSSGSDIEADPSSEAIDLDLLRGESDTQQVNVQVIQIRGK